MTETLTPEAPAPVRDRTIRRIDGGPVFQSRFITHRLDDVRFPDGTRGTYSVISPTEGYGVVAIPVATRNGVDHVGLVSQFRYPVGRESLELVRGGAPEPSAPEAARELREETGIEPGPAEFLGVINPDTGMLSTEVAVYVFRQPASDMDVQFEELESGALTSWYTWPELTGLIRDGHIRCGVTLASLCSCRPPAPCADR